MTWPFRALRSCIEMLWNRNKGCCKRVHHLQVTSKQRDKQLTYNDATYIIVNIVFAALAARASSYTSTCTKAVSWSYTHGVQAFWLYHSCTHTQEMHAHRSCMHVHRSTKLQACSPLHRGTNLHEKACKHKNESPCTHIHERAECTRTSTETHACYVGIH